MFTVPCITCLFLGVQKVFGVINIQKEHKEEYLSYRNICVRIRSVFPVFACIIFLWSVRTCELHQACWPSLPSCADSSLFCCPNLTLSMRANPLERGAVWKPRWQTEKKKKPTRTKYHMIRWHRWLIPGSKLKKGEIREEFESGETAQPPTKMNELWSSHAVILG